MDGDSLKQRMRRVGRGKLAARPLLIGLLLLLLLAAWPLLVTETKPLCGLAFSPAGNELAALRGIPHDVLDPPMRFELAVWDVAMRQERLVIPLDVPGWGLAFSLDGKTLAFGTQDGDIQLWDAASGRKIAAWSAGAAGSANWLAFVGSSGLLVSNGDQQGPMLWDAASGKLLSVAPKGERASNLSLQGARLAVAHWDRKSGSGKAWLYDLSGRRFKLLRSLPPATRGLALSADGLLFAFDQNPGIRVFALSVDRDACKLNGPNSLEMAFSPVANVLAVRTFSPDRRQEFVQLWDPLQGKSLHTFSNASSVNPPLGNGLVRFSPDGRRLAIGNEDGELRIWDVATGKLLVELPKHALEYWKIAALVSLFVVWCAAWVVSGRHLKRRGAAVLDVVQINALLLAALLVRLFAAGQPYYDPRRPVMWLMLALLTSWISLVAVWAIFGRTRWPVRLFGLGFAVTLAYAALQLLLGPLAWLLAVGAAVFLGWLLTMLRSCRELGFCLCSSQVEEPSASPATQINLKDLLLWTAAIASFFAVARLPRAESPPLAELMVIAAYTACLAVVVMSAAIFALSTARLWLQLVSLVALTLICGWMASLLSGRAANLFMARQIGAYLAIAAFIWGTLMVFRLHGCRMTRTGDSTPLRSALNKLLRRYLRGGAEVCGAHAAEMP